MLYVLVLLIVFIIVILFFSYRNKQAYKEKRIAIIKKWGQPIDSSGDVRLISAYYNHYAEEDHGLSDAVATDIDLGNVFDYADRTNSKPGQQYLYRKLRATKKDISSLQALDQLADQFEANPDLRIATEIELTTLGNKNAYYIHELFTTHYNSLYDKWTAFYLRVAGLLWIMSVAFTIIYQNQFLFFLALSLTVYNFYLHYSNKKKISSYVHSLPQLYTLINVVKLILKSVDASKNEKVSKSLTDIAPLQRSLSWLKFQDKVDQDPTDVSSGVLELIKTLLVLEPLMFLISVNRINQQKKSIEVMFNYVAEMDVAISIASLRAGLPYYSKPVFIAEGQDLDVTDLYHPLVEGCVPNSILVSTTQGVLITGSNMSGKTTFIRSIAINALLSQTLFTSCSQKYQSPFLQIFTSIRLSDDLEEHKSYFQAEALSILNIVKNSSSETSSLIIIDEIFRGTNTIERVAAAKAILSYLTANKNFTFVSTHDLELAELLGQEYAVYSFEELVSDTRLIFDYKIKTGILKHKNAIAILSSLGYPELIVDDANEISAALREKYKL